MADHSSFAEQNRRAWDEIAEIRERKWPGAEFFAAGNSTLDERVLDVAGEITGKSVLHLQCATGEDTLSWAIAGARATGVDISEKQVDLAKRKAAQAGIDCRFLASDIYSLPAQLQEQSFDLVYTGGGVLVWLPDLQKWAQIIERALKAGGRFILFEEHPIAMCMEVEDGAIRLTSDYFGRGKPDYSHGWTHFSSGENASQTKVEFMWPLGDVVTALADAGLRIDRLEEFPSRQEWRFRERLQDMSGLPGEFLLQATKQPT